MHGTWYQCGRQYNDRLGIVLTTTRSLHFRTKWWRGLGLAANLTCRIKYWERDEKKKKTMERYVSEYQIAWYLFSAGDLVFFDTEIEQ